MDFGADGDDLSVCFEAAANFLASAVTSGDTRFDDKAKLGFYGLYKQATAGKCTTNKPAFWDFAGKAKWDAWSKLGDLSQEAAMQQYVDLLGQISPDWDAAASTSGGRRAAGKTMGPVFSSLAAADDGAAQPDDGRQTLHELAGQGDLEAVRHLLAAGTATVNSRDDSGATALHFAADRGHAAMAQALIDAGANVNAQDEEGQTPLHFAAMTENLEVYKVLLAAGADAAIADHQGSSAQEVAPGWWVYT